ncbi:MAG: outer membrane beta-barrel protein [Prevotella sp.]|nr:outer membrane beta-barrel protein [Prevotella sp.]
MAKKNIIFILFLMLSALTTAAQTSKDSIYVYGIVADGFTKAAVPDAFVTLMRQDSTVVDTISVQDSHTWVSGVGRGNATSRYYFKISREPQDYIIKVEHPNYETAFANYKQKRVSRRLQYTDVPTVYLKKAARAHHFEGGELGEVVVKATRVKMVWKGDTLVFNADAFNVPEGSMLDGLIRQLPGVELTDEGEIFVNGKKVENLTLNGADFFKGKNKVMLDNLPYFTVKNIQVYNKQTEENKFLGIDDEDKKEYTMDVVLKREYSIGGSANLEAGYGTDDRYKLKGFGLRFSDRTRAVLFGGLNNINETMEYSGDRSSYNEKRNQSGDRHFRQVGGQFVYQAPENRLTNSTEVDASWQDDQTETRRQSETYMSDASTFGMSQGTSRSKPTSLNMRNTLRATWEEKWRMYSDLQLSYDRNRNESEGWNLTTADAVMTDSINSSWYRSRSQNDRFGGRGYASLTRKLATGDAISLTVNGNFSRQYNPDSWSLNHYDYHKTGTTDHRDRYTHSPGHNYSYSAGLSYRYQLTADIDINPEIAIGTSENRGDRHEYLRDSIDYLFDQQNSYEQHTRTLDRRASLDFSFNKQFKSYSMYVGPTFSINFQRQRMRYDSQPLTTDLTRHYTLFQPNVYFYIMSKDQTKNIWGQYYLYPSTPSVTDLIDRPITSDPLNIYLGNPDLKMQMQHNWSLSLQLRRDSIDQTIRFNIDGSIIHNQQAQGYTYDLTTGIRTYRPENISSGNWNLSATANWTRALGKQKFFHITNEVTLRYNKSTGLALTTGSTSSELSRVGNFFVRYKPNIRYQKQNLTLRLKGEVNYRNIHRNITVGNQPTDIWDFSYGINGSYKLPWQFTIDTDLTMNSHRGYADTEMNDNRLYWDASLTKSFAQGRWMLKLRGYDLLGQVSSLRYSINAQGRTETWTNSMRRYAMLTASYRFSQKPKK